VRLIGRRPFAVAGRLRGSAECSACNRNRNHPFRFTEKEKPVSGVASVRVFPEWVVCMPACSRSSLSLRFPRPALSESAGIY
jgi:hypothetical protein